MTGEVTGRPGPVRIEPLGGDGLAGRGPVELAEALTALGPVALLEAAGDGEREKAWTYVAPALAGRLTVEDGRARLTTPAGRRELVGEPCAVLDRVCARLELTPEASVPEGAPPFTGGLIGAISYDLAYELERIGTAAAADRPRPDLELYVAETVVAIPPGGGPALLVQRPLVSDPERLGEVAEEVRRRLAAVAAAPPAGEGSERPRTVTTSLPAAAYRAGVRRALGHIRDGEVFQVNLAQRLTAPWEASPWRLYRRLSAQSPAPHGAVVPVAGGAAVSVSPETFLVAAGRRVTTRPIKGTRPRSTEPAEDRRLAAELSSSAKDRAENVMIVDVQRNDLGRVCTTGSVDVPRLAEVVAHPTVWHLESEVTGRLRAGCGWGELLGASFPCGSVTGAPKVRAMQLIDALEPVRRGLYCGAIGFLSAGRLRLSVGIRTAVVAGGVADYGAGGGIVADSDPAEEHAESLDKAVAFLRAVAAREVVAARPRRPAARRRP